jgi:hypothetical protein
VRSKLPIAALIALVVLVALFASSVGLGVRGGRGKGPALTPDLNAPWVQRLRQRMTRSLQEEDLRVEGGSAPGCRIGGGQLQVPTEGACRFAIAAANATRPLRLRLVQGTTVVVTLEQEGALAIEDEPLAAGEAAKSFDVYRNEEDGRLTIAECKVDGHDRSDRPAICLISLE